MSALILSLLDKPSLFNDVLLKLLQADAKESCQKSSMPGLCLVEAAQVVPRPQLFDFK